MITRRTEVSSKICSKCGSRAPRSGRVLLTSSTQTLAWSPPCVRRNSSDVTLCSYSHRRREGVLRQDAALAGHPHKARASHLLSGAPDTPDGPELPSDSPHKSSVVTSRTVQQLYQLESVKWTGGRGQRRPPCAGAEGAFPPRRFDLLATRPLPCRRRDKRIAVTSLERVMDLDRLRDDLMEEKTSERSLRPTAANRILMRNHTRPPAAGAIARSLARPRYSTTSGRISCSVVPTGATYGATKPHPPSGIPLR